MQLSAATAFQNVTAMLLRPAGSPRGAFLCADGGDTADFFFARGQNRTEYRGMPASPEFTYHFVRGLAWDAAQSGRSLVGVFEIASRGWLVDTPRGKVFAGAAADGATVTFMLPPRGRLRGFEIAKLAGELARARSRHAGEFSRHQR